MEKAGQRWRCGAGRGGPLRKCEPCPTVGGGGGQGQPADMENGSFQREPPGAGRGLGSPMGAAEDHWPALGAFPENPSVPGCRVPGGAQRPGVSSAGKSWWVLEPGWWGRGQSWAGLEVRTRGADAQDKGAGGESRGLWGSHLSRGRVRGPRSGLGVSPGALNSADVKMEMLLPSQRMLTRAVFMSLKLGAQKRGWRCRQTAHGYVDSTWTCRHCGHRRGL